MIENNYNFFSDGCEENLQDWLRGGTALPGSVGFLPIKNLTPFSRGLGSPPWNRRETLLQGGATLFAFQSSLVVPRIGSILLRLLRTPTRTAPVVRHPSPASSGEGLLQ